MGIRGLTTYIARDPNRYLTPIKLKNSYLVIDGSCVSSHLYKWCTKRDSAFGGDYDEYCITVKKFFLALKKCQITPVIIMDGGYENKKIKTVINRLKDKLMSLKTTYAKGFCSSKFFPLFMKTVFCEAAACLDITIIQCELEADGAIAELSRHLNCPVLSYDSDFFVFDVLYIPFSTIELDFSNPTCNDGLPCSLYKLENFLDEYPGLQKLHLPLICTLLGNDFIPSYIFINFFKQIPLSRAKNLTNLDKRILGLLNWLKNESEASAITKIQSFIGKSKYEMLEKSIKVSKDSYEINNYFKVEIVSGKLNIRQPPFSLKLDDDFIDLLVSCKLPSLIINMILLRCYFLPLQIEDINSESAHEVAFPLINQTYQMLCSSTGETQDLVLFMRQGKHIKQRTLLRNTDEELVNLNDTLKMSLDLRTKLIFKTLNMDEEDQKCINAFPNKCQLFICCFIYWNKEAKPCLEHLHGLLLGYLGCQSKNRVGPCRVGQSWSLSTDHLTKFTSILGAYRKTSEQSKIKFNCSIIHAFSQFQSILYHCSVLNTLLGNPLPPCKVSDSFNGTLCFNLYLKFLAELNIIDTIKYLFDSTNTVFGLYSSYCDMLSRYFAVASRAAQNNKVRKKRKKTKKTVAINLVEDIIQDDSDNASDSYIDVNNKFYALKI